MFAFGFPFNVYMCGHTYVESVCMCLCVCSPEVDVWSPFQLISTLLIEVSFLSLSVVLLIYVIWLAGLLCGSPYPPCCHGNDSLTTTSTQNIYGFYGLHVCVPRTMPSELYPQPSTCNCSMLASEIIVNVLYLPIMTTMHDNTIKIRF